ncbi:MAG: divergent polysaccharide deacetylase family protein [Candidatus Omnitrophota bacterium]|nr:divergent polysaccharide deacetylase family protein [Candidatus Omnitrophota bacterium]
MAQKRRKKIVPKRNPKKAPAVFAWIFGFIGIAILCYTSCVAIDKFTVQPDSGKPKIAFVIDDIGHHRAYEGELRVLNNNVTYAILPHLRYSDHFTRLSRKTGAEVILHLPLETVDGTIPGPGLITRSMQKQQVLEILARNLDSVPRHVGVNNHMGSLGTTSVPLMDTILTELKNRKLFFLDSQTTSDSVAASVGTDLGVPVLSRDIFLDNVDSLSAIQVQIERLAAASAEKGYAVGIGHFRRNTLNAIADAIPRLRQEGFEVTSLSKLAKKK